jgi:lysophospholipase L1-like esterase
LLGFRGDEFSVEKLPKTVRIACVGASTTFCSEASNNAATWPARLQALLQAKYPDVNIQVINAGVGGYVITDSLKNLEHRVLPLEPDLVIFYEANNDMALDTRNLAKERGVIGKTDSYRSPFTIFMSERSLLYDLVNKNLVVLFSRRDVTSGKLADLPADLPDRFVGQLQPCRLLSPAYSTRLSRC